ncbi:pyridoxamine 5'-phosphate oxidase family protein [Pelagicoccus sp. SDUM812002]|uniref:pyridoxamine 5'-phosphate oxidase family protein n=1 Tax=Pelagicoccus sp. SDUM812002 TaxID=3041266 RepID=UPI00280E5C47|nr:pyridoxamine 5'-phosphate oxidase family protein [Pelagicoccus sp. SDUM812002]MDQ8185085.1 pyridoxamine 5'-phosphate oxidase family protein [Pelagicoccus sp. SDUM812002]
MSCPFAKTDRTQPNRSPKRVSFEREPVFAVIDEAPICHVGFTLPNGQPFVIPTIHARVDHLLYFHGSTQSRLLMAIASGNPICCTFTFLDGIVAARSAMHHSMNYRSVVAFGTGYLLEDEAERQEAFRLTVEKLIPGRWENCRQPNEAEAKATAIAALRIEEATLKVRSGPPSDIASDMDSAHWAGVLPMQTVYGAPIPDPQLPNGLSVPPHIQALV